MPRLSFRSLREKPLQPLLAQSSFMLLLHAARHARQSRGDVLAKVIPVEIASERQGSLAMLGI